MSAKFTAVPILILSLSALKPAPLRAQTLFQQKVYRATLEEKITEKIIPVSADALADGTLLVVERQKGAIEISKGSISRRYSSAGREALAVCFGPSKTRYILFWSPEGALISVYDSAGNKIRDISSPQMVYTNKFVINSGGEIVALGPWSVFQPETGPVYLLHRYAQDGRRLGRYHAFQGNTGADLRMFRQSHILNVEVALSDDGEMAISRPDEKRIYWLDSRGNAVSEIQFDGIPTALRVGIDGLTMVAAERIPTGSPASGIFAFKLSNPKLYHFETNGRKSIVSLPPSAVSVRKIDADGTLIQWMVNSVKVFSPY